MTCMARSGGTSHHSTAMAGSIASSVPVAPISDPARL
jgi:hypothetical protein